ncbi:MAG: hypothetical protein ACYTAN_09995 [Planctomycetota bacterium]|jgi:hypothetical protein
MGYFFERVGKAFSFIWAAIRMAFKDKDLFLPSIFSLVANIAYITLIIVVLAATNTLWLIGLEQSDVEEIKEAGRILTDGPVAVAEERDAAIEARIEEGDAAYKAAMERGEDPAQYIQDRAAAIDREVAAEMAAEREARREAEEKSKRRAYVRGAFGAVTLFGAFIITYIFSGMTVSLVYDHLSGKDARIGEAFAVVMKRLPGIVLLAVISTIVSILAQAARGKEGKRNVVGAIVGGLIQSLWTIASFLILPAIVIHNLSLWQGLKRAKEIAAGNLLIVAVGEIAVGLVANLIAFLGIMAGVIVGVFTFRIIPQPFYIPLGAGGVVALIAIAFTMYVKQAYYTCLYVNAVESAKLGQRAAARGPLADALA